MVKLFRIVILILCLIGFEMPASANSPVGSDTTEATNDNYDWEPVMKAIIQVESEGNTKAVKGNSCGAMQITPILVMECNNILKKRKSKKKFSLRDRFSLAKSKEMFVLMQSYFNPTNDIEKAIRSWNGGMNYSKAKTQRYFEKVMSFLKH